MEEQRKKQALGFTIILSIILFTSMISFQFGFTSVPVAGPYYLDVPFGDANYYVGLLDDGDTYMVDGDTWQNTFTSSDQDAVLHACINNLTNGGKIVIVGGVTFEDITISQDGIIISGDSSAYKYDFDGIPMIRHLTYSSTSANITCGLVENMHIGELMFQPDNLNFINGLVFRGIDFMFTRHPDFLSNGIIVNATSYQDTLTHYVDFIYFDHCGFHGSVMEGFGLVNFYRSGRGVAMWVFHACDFGLFTYDNSSYVKWFSEGFGNRIQFTGNTQFYSGRNNSTLFDFEASNIPDGEIRSDGAEISHCAIEIHNNVTLVRIASGSKTNRGLSVSFNDNIISAYDEMTLINNSQASFDLGSRVIFESNDFTGDAASSVLLGTPNESANFNFYASNNLGFLTENYGSSVNATATTWSLTHGLAGTPTFVSCSFNSTNWDSWRWTSTSTTITVTCVNRVVTDAIVACYWYARYEP